MFTDKQKNSVINVDKLHFAVLTANTSADYAHPAMDLIEGTIQVAVTPVTASGELYADGVLTYADSSNVGFDLTIEAVSLPETVKSAMFGNAFDPITGKGTVKSTDVSPEIAIAFRTQMRDGQFKFVKIPACVASLTEETYSTKTGEIAYQTANITIKGTSRLLDGVLKEIQLAGVDGAEGATFFGAIV